MRPQDGTLAWSPDLSLRPLPAVAYPFEPRITLDANHTAADFRDYGFALWATAGLRAH